MRLPLYQVDAFASRPFEGNPAAVVLLERWLPEALMQAIAAENNLAETAFVCPAGAGFELRWFTPTLEIDLCGHATLACAFVLFETVCAGNRQVTFSTRSGMLTVTRRADGWLELDFPARPGVATVLDEALVAAIGGAPSAQFRARDVLLVYGSETEVSALRPDFRSPALQAFGGVIVTAPGQDADFVSRFFAPGMGIDEDPVTGSAHCTLVPYWASRLGKANLSARQISARGGFLRCTHAGERVRMAGQAVLFMQGEIEVSVPAFDII